MQWLRGRSVPPEDQRLARLRRVLHYAISNTRYARAYDREMACVEQVPKLDLFEFLCHPERYSVEKASSCKAEQLKYPLGNAPRTAVVGRMVAESRRVRCFSSLYAEKLRAFEPQALAAPLDALRAAAGEAAAPLRNAVIVFSGILEGPLTPADGDELWRRYEVPVFEQFLGLNGELLAWECEIHHGLHVREEAAYFEEGEERLLVSFLANRRLPLLRLETGLTGQVVTDPCPCGDPAPRLMGLRRRAARCAAAGAVDVAAVS